MKRNHNLNRYERVKTVHMRAVQRKRSLSKALRICYIALMGSLSLTTERIHIIRTYSTTKESFWLRATKKRFFHEW
jgi:hypothetical protein